MKATVMWVKSDHDLAFEGQTDSGHSISLNGDGKGLSPMESVLMSVGACSSVDVVEIMRKARQTLDSCHVELSAERAESPPRVFTKIHAHFVVSGEKVQDKHLQRAVALSTEKYCSVMLMLNQTVAVTTSYEVK